MKILRLIPSLYLIFLPSLSFADWSSYMGMTTNYFEGVSSTSARIVLTMDTDFHACGWNNAVDINQADVGDTLFKTISAVVLAAWMGNKSVALQVAGCDGDRARVIAIRIGK